MRKIVLLWLVATVALTQTFGQEEETAKMFLERLSKEYASMKDYQAFFTVRRAGRTEAGALQYKAPNNLRIDFSTPKDQVLVISNDLLQLYVPRYEMIMEQKLKKGDAESAGGLASGNGLKLLQENYTVSYVNGPGLQPLQSGSSQMVYKLKFEWRNFTEGFRTLEVSVSRDMRIVRIVALTSLFETIQFDYSSIRINQNIPGSVFVLQLDSQNKVNKYPDFLKSTE